MRTALVLKRRRKPRDGLAGQGTNTDLDISSGGLQSLRPMGPMGPEIGNLVPREGSPIRLLSLSIRLVQNHSAFPIFPSLQG